MVVSAGKLLPVDREVAEIESVDRVALADDGGHGLAAEARLASAKTG